MSEERKRYRDVYTDVLRRIAHEYFNDNYPKAGGKLMAVAGASIEAATVNQMKRSC